jgi:hypothetical protein
MTIFLKHYCRESPYGVDFLLNMEKQIKHTKRVTK